MPLAVVRSDPLEEAVEFLRRELSEEVLEQFREVVRAEALDALDCVVGRFVQQMLRANGFVEEELGVESLETAWHDLIRRAVA
ncbi:MAG TPA: hypothetical protein VHG28_08780 [Longimicrobiaceae bacterium]|nr:hypothetical protein [Longimicrobiaceae bacterium]